MLIVDASSLSLDIHSTVATGVYSLWFFYTEQRYGWGAVLNGIFLAMYGILTAISQVSARSRSRGGAVSCHPRATSPLATSPPSPPLAPPCRKPPTHHRYVRGGTVAQGALLRRLVPQHFTSAQVCIAGYFTNALVFALYGLCRKGWALFSVLPLCGIASLSDPVLRSTMTSHVSPEEQGLFQVRCRARWSQVKCARGFAHS